MNICRLIIAFACLAVATSAVAEEPARTEYGFPSLPGSKPLDASSYTLKFLRAKPDANHGKMGFFSFRHSRPKPLRLWGFGFEDDGSFRVRFEQFSALVNGRWTPRLFGYCGTGAQTYELQPNLAYTLRVPLGALTSEGDQGVVQIAGDSCVLYSEEFALAPIRKAK